MSSLGFSVDNKTPPGLRRVSDIRDGVYNEQNHDVGFIAGMFCLGLAILALGAWHDQARALLGSMFGF